MEHIEVKVGQVWADCDKRMRDRCAKVIAVSGEYAVLTEGERYRPIVLSIKRMRPTSTGWRLVDEYIHH